MNSKALILVLLCIVCLSQCNKSKPKAGADTSTAVTDGCADLDAQSARMRCANNNVEFCSAFSKYKWMETQKCPAEKKCFIAADGKAGGCK